MSRSFEGRCLVDGEAEAEILYCTDKIPGWGGISYATGEIIEVGHPQFGQSIAGKILVIPGAKGASGWSGQFHIARVNGVGPAAVVTRTLNTKLALGIAVAEAPALIDLPEEAYALMQTGRRARICGSTLTFLDED
ncbi:DUF126 domain-containing protein [Microbacterium sp. BWT-B31]|uniref:aconitase X swivel domain-containing protein n=1 Tax=Microbacterium sp. BWT-B31 TaxID=3232072 RepID=UPI00352747D5